MCTFMKIWSVIIRQTFANISNYITPNPWSILIYLSRVINFFVHWETEWVITVVERGSLLRKCVSNEVQNPHKFSCTSPETSGIHLKNESCYCMRTIFRDYISIILITHSFFSLRLEGEETLKYRCVFRSPCGQV